MSRINWKPNDRLVCNFFPNLSKWLDLDGPSRTSEDIRNYPKFFKNYHFVEQMPKTNFEKSVKVSKKLFLTDFNKNVLVSSLEIF